MESDLLVVEANITSESKNHVVRLSLPYAKQNQPATPVTGAIVVIAVDDTPVLLTEFPSGSGMYYTPVMNAVTGKIYTLFIQYQNRNYYAQDTPPAVEPMEELHYQPVGDEYSFAFGQFGDSPNFIKHIVDWSGTQQCGGSGNCFGEVYFYDLKSADVNDAFKPDKEPFVFPANSVVVRTKYSVSTSYRAFLRSMLSETEWRGGFFDVQRAPVTTNLSEGAVGFFAVSTVTSDTTVVH